MSEPATQRNLEWELVADTIPVAIFTFDAAGVGYANPAAEELTGRPREQLEGLPFWALYEEQDQEALESWERAWAAGESPAGRPLAHLPTAEGPPRRVEIHAAASGGSTVVAAVLDVTPDATEQRAAEEIALSSERELTRALLESVGNGVVRVGAEGTVRHLSPAAEELTGWKLADALDKPLSRIFRAYDVDSKEPIKDPLAHWLAGPAAGGASTVELQRRDGSNIEVRCFASVTRRSSERPDETLLVIQDMTEIARAQRSLLYQATHDSLTGLVNRTEFERRLGAAIAGSQADGRRHTLCYIDLDKFKLVNDSCGHLAGDKMLQQLSSFIKCRFRETDVLGRLGGDEFGVLLEDCGTRRARELLDQLYQELRSFRFTWEERSFGVGLSTGIVEINAQTGELAELMGSADSASFIAKQNGGNRLQEYEAQDEAVSVRTGQVKIVRQLHQALAKQSFQLYYQPMRPLRGDAPEMYELLVRMIDEGGIAISPGAFIPVAERNGLISAIDRWVVRSALEFITNRAGEIFDPHSSFSINLSGQSIGEEDFLEFVVREFERLKPPPHRVCFEITETAAVSDLDRALRFIATLKGEGCRFILDDFGTGLSSFAYLRSFPVDFVKIEGQFVLNMTKDPIQRALVESINHIGHVMQMRTIAEFVEDEATYNALTEMGVDYGQGYWIARPVPLATLPQDT